MPQVHINDLPTHPIKSSLATVSGNPDEIIQQAIARAQDSHKVMGGQAIDLKTFVLTGYIGPNQV